MTSVDDVFEALKPVMDPEHPVSITDPRMQIVKKEYISVDDGIQVQFKPTVPYCPMGGLIGILIRHRLEEVYPDKKIHVKLVPGTHSQEQAVNLMISDNERYRQIVEQLKEKDML
ncbi:MAG: hypothetical protein BAJATHORv1_10188 [Candidatus Thorarchaeota archaeon]|nr:MAG: hypothetical protein BAJATHORv1_10188 [Candidatus Thorarchaeota archaeon]